MGSNGKLPAHGVWGDGVTSQEQETEGDESG